MTVIFPEHLAVTKEHLLQSYLADSRPWVVAYSGGKDSTTVLQLVYELIVGLGDKATKPVHVVASDTMVEAPNVEDYISQCLEALRRHAASAGMAHIHVHHVRPEPDQTFWVNLIGRGYPSPTRVFRWCTTKMKIKPSRKVIDAIVAEHGSVVLLLGTRSAESSSRAQRMEARERNERGLNPHHEIPNALVYAPIADWSNDEVWEYLLTNNPAPWGLRHDFMLNLYRQAGGGECPVILDLNTPSCGGSRFGCWTCTVVKQDRSMQGFLDAGEVWMRPLATFRDNLKRWRERPELRLAVRRNEEPGPGPFTLAARLMILGELLETERLMPDGRRLIQDEEIAQIQRQWRKDGDRSESAVRLAARYGRIVAQGAAEAEMHDYHREFVADLALKHEIQEQWVDDLLYLIERKYSSADLVISPAGLKRDVRSVIDRAAEQERITAQ